MAGRSTLGAAGLPVLGAAPQNPPSGQRLLYVKGSTIYTLDSAGTEDPVLARAESDARYLRSDDALFRTHPFGGRRVYLNYLENAFWLAHERFTVTATRHLQSDNSLVATITPDNLFTGSYESAQVIPAGQYLKVLINFNGTWPGYPYGKFFISTYTGRDLASASYRIYTNYAPQGGPGWIGPTNFTPSPASSQGAYIWEADETIYQPTQVEFTIMGKPAGTTTPNNGETWVTRLDYYLTRPGEGTGFPVHRADAENLFHRTAKWVTAAGAVAGSVDRDGVADFTTLRRGGRSVVTHVGSGVQISYRRGYDLCNNSWTTADVSGDLIIQTNIPFNHNMTRLHIQGYNYLAGSVNIDVKVGFYATATGPAFANVFAQNDGELQFSQVRLMRNASNKVAVVLTPAGLPGNLWDYPKITVDLIAGHTALADADLEGWVATIGATTGLTAMTTIVPTEPTRLLDSAAKRTGTHSTTSTTFVDVDATNLSVTFTAPASGAVIVRLSALANGSDSGVTGRWTCSWGLRTTTADVANTSVLVASNMDHSAFRSAPIKITGLTPGTSYTYRWAHKANVASSTSIVDATSGATMEVWAA